MAGAMTANDSDHDAFGSIIYKTHIYPTFYLLNGEL